MTSLLTCGVPRRGCGGDGALHHLVQHGEAAAPGDTGGRGRGRGGHAGAGPHQGGEQHQQQHGHQQEVEVGAQADVSRPPCT